MIFILLDQFDFVQYAKMYILLNTAQVSDVRLPREGDSQRPKGFGYAEIDDIESLYKALSLDNSVSI